MRFRYEVGKMVAQIPPAINACGGLSLLPHMAGKNHDLRDQAGFRLAILVHVIWDKDFIQLPGHTDECRAFGQFLEAVRPHISAG